jgi:hypothetical protein
MDAATLLVPPNSREVDLFGLRWSWDPAISDLARGPFCPDRGHGELLRRTTTNQPPRDEDVIGAPGDPLICDAGDRHAVTFTEPPSRLGNVRERVTELMRARRI